MKWLNSDRRRLSAMELDITAAGLGASIFFSTMVLNSRNDVLLILVIS